MKTYIKNLILLFFFLQTVLLTQAIERKIQKSASISAVEKSSELKEMMIKIGNEPRLSIRPYTQREKELILEMDKQRSFISWLAFGIHIVLVFLFSWFAVTINRQKSNNSLKRDPVSGSACHRAP